MYIDANSNGVWDANETRMAGFTYDADGKRMKSVIGGATTIFVGSWLGSGMGGGGAARMVKR